MKKSTYLLDREDEILISEEIMDEHGNVLSSKTIDGRFTEVVLKEYNAQNLAVKISSYENDILLNTVAISYDESDAIVEQTLSIGDEVYERVSTQKNAEGFIRSTFEDGEKVEVLIHKEDDGGYKDEYYANGELFQYQINQKKTRENIESVKVFDQNDQLISVMIYQYDKQDRLLQHQEYSGGEHLLREEIYEFSASLLEKVTMRDFENEAQSYIQTNQYDQKKNLTKQETRTLTGNLIEFQTFVYDNRNKCTEEVLVTVGESDLFSGNSAAGAKMHLVHRYES